MEERDRSGRLSPEIYVYATNKNFLNIYDALRIEKVKVEIAGYDPNTNRQTGHASAWLDLADARLLCHLTTDRLFADVTGGKWEKFGGSQRDDGRLESRIITVEWDKLAGDKLNTCRIANGPGRKTQTGGVSPDGPPTSSLSMRLTEMDMIKVMLSLGDYIHAYEAAHHNRIVAERVRELRDKLEARADRAERVQVPERSEREERPQRVPQPAGAPALQAIPGGLRGQNAPASVERDRSRLTPLRSERTG